MKNNGTMIALALAAVVGLGFVLIQPKPPPPPVGAIEFRNPIFDFVR